MEIDYGPQYAQDDNFKAKARLHQSKFRVDYLGADCKDYGNRLAKREALAGKNFYLGYTVIFKEVKKRYHLKYSPLFYDMLRSEHAPFNFFIPLRYDIALGVNILNCFMKDTIYKIETIEIEYAPKPRSKYLNDRTAFDAYIEYVHLDGSPGFIGIEMKYTEKEYPYGNKEKTKINDAHSVYNVLTKRIGIYKQEYLETLKTAKFKQVWRNQLLGERILEMVPRFKHFTSVILYPRDNEHFANVCSSYESFFNENVNRFIGITFEDFIEAGLQCSIHDSAKQWLGYLKSRYLIVN